MGASQSDFQEHFASLSDAALVQVNRADLVRAAQAVYDEEMDRRGLLAEEEKDQPAGSPALSSSGGEKLVTVVEFESVEDAGQAVATLKKNGIPAYVAVAVPAAFEGQAVALLDPGISEEDLAALAENSATAGEP